MTAADSSAGSRQPGEHSIISRELQTSEESDFIRVRFREEVKNTATAISIIDTAKSSLQEWESAAIIHAC